LHNSQILISGVQNTQYEQTDETGDHEQSSGNDPAPCLMQKPADVRRQLLRLGTGQQHAIIECMQKPAFADPALFFHQVAVHHRDLARRAAEAVERHLDPKPKRLAEGHGNRRQPHASIFHFPPRRCRSFDDFCHEPSLKSAPIRYDDNRGLPCFGVNHG
jgi:hypothetical protein